MRPSMTSRPGSREFAAGKEPGQWIRGWGFDDTLIEEKRHLNVVGSGRGGAALIPSMSPTPADTWLDVNSAALRMAGIGPATPQPEGGEIHMDSRGEPTGLLAEEPAQRLVLELIPPYPVPALRESMAESMGVFHRAGITRHQ